MPQETYYKLKDEKRQRVYDAVLNEYTRVPLEAVSVKNIVTEAGIPRGSFYQYFVDKEGALRYLIQTIQQVGERQVLSGIVEEKLDLFQLIKAIFSYEANALGRHEETLRAKLLKQTAESARGTSILFEEISAAVVRDKQYQEFWKRANLGHLSEESCDVIIDMLFSALRESLLTIIKKTESVKDAEGKLDLKIAIVKSGIEQVIL